MTKQELLKKVKSVLSHFKYIMFAILLAMFAYFMLSSLRIVQKLEKAAGGGTQSSKPKRVLQLM